MGGISKIFGADKVIKGGFDLIDSIHTSDEEEIEAKAKAKTDLLTAYAPFKLAQRYLALLFACVFLLSFFLTLIMTLGNWGDIKEVKEVLSDFYIGEIMVTIIVFYFGGGFLEGSIKARVK